MRTKIEYSMDLKDVPQKLKEKLLDITTELQRLTNYVEALSSDLEYEPVTTVIARLERTRRRLFVVDSALEDCDKAMQGYAATITQLQQQAAAATDIVNETAEENNA